MDRPYIQQSDAVEDEIDLKEIVQILRRNRWLIFGVLAVALSATAFITFRATPIYEAATAIRINEKQSGFPALEFLTSIPGRSEVATEMEVLRTRTLAEEVVDSLGLRLQLIEPRKVRRNQVFDYIRIDPDAPAAEYILERRGDLRFEIRDRETGTIQGHYAPGERITLPGATLVLAPGAAEFRTLRIEVADLNRSVRAFREATTVSRPNREANIVVVRYQNSDIDLAHRVPNTLARRFIDRNRTDKRLEASSTVAFLREQIDTLSSQLRAAEDALRSFREGRQIVSLETEASSQVRELTQLQAQRNAIDAERAALAALLAETQAMTPQEGEPSPYRRLLAFPSLFRNQAATELLRSLSVVENERTELLKRRTARDPDVIILTERIHQLEEQLRVIAVTYLQGLTNQVESLDVTLSRFGNELAKIPAKEVQFARLARQTRVLEEIYTLLQTRLKEAEIAQAVEDASVKIVDPAVAPDRPIKPRKMLNLALGGMLGLMLGIGVAFLREFMDSSVRTREDLQNFSRVPVLGVIPRIKEAVRLNGRAPRSVGPDSGELETRLVTGRDPRNPVSEAYRSLRTNITFARPEDPVKTLVFTSPMPGEGKSTTSANLAITLAQQGLKVLLIDADMRKGFLNDVFRVPREPGLSNVLFGATAPENAIREIDLGASGVLHFMGTGTIPPNPAELLGSTRMRDLLARLDDDYEMVLLDAPPLTLVTDAAVLGTNADGVIVVARSAKTHRHALEFAMDQLHNVRAPVLGTVLNDVDVSQEGYYGGYGYYQYYYGSAEESSRRGLRGLLSRIG